MKKEHIFIIVLLLINLVLSGVQCYHLYKKNKDEKDQYKGNPVV